MKYNPRCETVSEIHTTKKELASRDNNKACKWIRKIIILQHVSEQKKGRGDRKGNVTTHMKIILISSVIWGKQIKKLEFHYTLIKFAKLKWGLTIQWVDENVEHWAISSMLVGIFTDKMPLKWNLQHQAILAISIPFTYFYILDKVFRIQNKIEDVHSKILETT